MKKFKDILYFYFAEKNWGVRREYGPYVDTHRIEHLSKPWKHRYLLLKLNFHYRILRRDTLLLPAVKTTVSPQKKDKAPRKVAPYSNSPESTKGNRQNSYAFARGLLKYDVISFDIFDTLILRHLNNPEDLFMMVGGELDIFNFHGIRIRAEREAREKKNALHGYREVTLLEIYERVSHYTGIDAQKGAEVEFGLELEMCFANPYMLQVYQILKSACKPIYITSNMYIPNEMMVKLLNNCGYDGFEEVLVSCDYKCAKTNGSLFHILKSKLPKNINIVHIGDNKAADISGANKASIEGKYYPSCRELGDPHRSMGMSALIQGSYRGLINNTLHNGTAEYSMFWEYGFVYGGIIALGYVNWIHQQAIENGCDKLLFVARDGYILKKVYDLMYHDIPSEYVYWSRVAAIRNVSVGDREPFLTRLFEERCNTGDTISHVLKLGGLSKLEKLFSENGFPPDLPLVREHYETIAELLVKNWNLVEDSLKQGQEGMLNYLKDIVGDNKKLALIDLGWTGRNLLTLEKTLTRIGMEKEFICSFVLGLFTRRDVSVRLQEQNIECYVFDSRVNQEIQHLFQKNRGIKTELIEKLFSTKQNSFLGFSDSGEMEFAAAEIDNYNAFDEIEEGILYFVEEYLYIYEKYPYMYNISGYDAFIPCRLLFNNIKSVEKIIGTLSYNKGISPNDRNKLLNLRG